MPDIYAGNWLWQSIVIQPFHNALQYSKSRVYTLREDEERKVISIRSRSCILYILSGISGRQIIIKFQYVEFFWSNLMWTCYSYSYTRSSTVIYLYTYICGNVKAKYPKWIQTAFTLKISIASLWHKHIIPVASSFIAGCK